MGFPRTVPQIQVPRLPAVLERTTAVFADLGP